MDNFLLKIVYSKRYFIIQKMILMKQFIYFSIVALSIFNTSCFDFEKSPPVQLPVCNDDTLSFSMPTPIWETDELEQQEAFEGQLYFYEDNILVHTRNNEDWEWYVVNKSTGQIEENKGSISGFEKGIAHSALIHDKFLIFESNEISLDQNIRTLNVLNLESWEVKEIMEFSRDFDHYDDVKWHGDMIGDNVAIIQKDATCSNCFNLLLYNLNTETLETLDFTKPHVDRVVTSENTDVWENSQGETMLTMSFHQGDTTKVININTHTNTIEREMIVPRGFTLIKEKDNILFVRSLELLHAFDINTFDLIWQTEELVRIPNQTKTALFGRSVFRKKLEVFDDVIVDINDNTIHIMSKLTGDIFIMDQTMDDWMARWSVDFLNNNFYYNQDTSLYKINIINECTEWSKSLPYNNTGYVSNPIIDKVTNKLYVKKGKKLLCIQL